ncbi:SMI1/KNR4 family protein SUKH-1 [Azorhizobium sp. AG788]|uniref:SMI1/KNR4 family protein n=1 Tax=Azorhizobium sp. AG788 TaxID=2183897 RepID=UPI0010D15959|nr:SMI1/KNR4 family protein [Azorhizobium sp. AG788]TDT99472.1 SMI1/KNR4 family protein SUKH-1 [Azorhizobium sp. AG788]
MTSIETAVSALRLEKDPSEPFTYSPEEIDALETLTGVRFPEDFRWYLAHVGWRKLDYDHATLLLRPVAHVYALEFRAVEHGAFAQRAYRDFERQAADLPDGASAYFPFGQMRGGSPQIILTLAIALRGADAGAVWAVRAQGSSADDEFAAPVRVAASFTDFLATVGPRRKLEAAAEKANGALFDRLLAEALAAPEVVPTRAPEPENLISRFFETPGDVTIDAARNVEVLARVLAQRVESAQRFAAEAHRFTTEAAVETGLLPPPLRRARIRFDQPVAFDRMDTVLRKTHGFRVVRVQSEVGEGHRLTEDYLVHQGKDGWTLLRREDARIADVKIRDVGTFAFDATYKWSLKKKVTPAWSERPADICVLGEEDALTPARTAFVAQVVDRADFRPDFESFVFALYRDRFYPEFAAMGPDEQRHWADSYPRLTRPDEIWRLLGKTLTLTIESDHTFALSVPANWDPEHGLSLRVTDWRIAA